MKKLEDDLIAQQNKELNAELDRLFRPVPDSVYTAHYRVDTAIESLEKVSLDYGAPLDLNPDFQRGHVWTQNQQEEFILAMFRKVLPESAMVIQFNCRNWNTFDKETGKEDLPKGFQCLDGLQRLTAMDRFLKNEISVKGIYASELAGSKYSMKRPFYQFRVNVFAYETKKEVLEHYLAFNSGGTVHPESEIQRVRSMLKSLGPNSSM